MADETGASRGRPGKPAQPGSRKPRSAGEVSGQEPAVHDQPAEVSDPAPSTTARAPDTEALERLRKRLMAKHHGWRR